MKCKFCNSKCTLINNFGEMPIANGFLESHAIDNYSFELVTMFCEMCKLFQLFKQPLPELMFNDRYPFFTGQSERMTKHFEDLVEFTILPLIKEKEKSFVVEIGSNDGTLLQKVKNRGIRHLGVDPSKSVNLEAESKGVSYVQAFFNAQTVSKIKKEYGQADVIVAANVICHVPDLKDLFLSVSELLKSDGIFIFEEPYLGDMIEKVSFDQIYDEHYYMFSVMSVQRICESLNLILFDIEQQNTHGGSMRYFVSNNNNKVINTRVIDGYQKELELGLDLVLTYLNFKKKCEEKKNKFISLIKKLKSEKFSVAGYAATSKSTTVLNYCNLNDNDITYICDSTPQKVGRFTPGTKIPIVSTEFMRNNPPDFLVLFAWNHELEILNKEREFLGGKIKWVKYVPEVEILDNWI